MTALADGRGMTDRIERRDFTDDERAEGVALAALVPAHQREWKSPAGRALAEWLAVKVADGVALAWAAELVGVSAAALRAAFGRLGIDTGLDDDD